MVLVEQPLDLVYNRTGRPAAVRHPVHRMTAPIASIGTASRGNQRERSVPMMFPPGLQVTRDLDTIAVGPGLRVERLNQVRRTGSYYVPGRGEKYDAFDGRPVHAIETGRNQLFEGFLAFSCDND